MSLFSRLFRRPQPPLAAAKPVAPAAAPSPDGSAAERAAAAKAAAAAKEETALKAAIDARDGPAISRLVVDGSSTKIRQLAAQAVEDPVMLRQLIRDVRGGNDKNVYKILTAKRDVLLAEERKTVRLHAEIAAAAAALDRHSRRPFDPLFGATLNQLEIRWNAVAADARAESVAEVVESINRARAVIAEHFRTLETRAQRELDRSNAAAEAERQRTTVEAAAAAAAAEQARILESERIAQAERHEARAQALREIGGLIRKAHGALSGGGTRRAAELRRAIDAKLAAAPPLPAHLSGHLLHLDSRLNELKDWKNFVVSPKRLELLEEIESLIGSPLDPPALADRIKALQGEWRTLGKGAGGHLESDQQRFQDAAQKAYQRCREYFEAEALVRRENLERRAALSERLAAFEAGHNWERPDWRLVITALRESKQEWRRYSPVERAAGEISQQNFAAVWERLQARLDAEYARNVETKRSLIARARELLASEDSRKAIDAAKELQQKWKEVGPVPRDTDNALWEEFRQHCDAVFQKRQQEFLDYTAELEANKSKATSLCDEVEKIAALSGADLSESARRLGGLREAFEMIGELPKGASRDVRNRFERALQRCERSVAEQHARDEERTWTQLFEAADRVRAYQLSKTREADPAERQARRQAAEDFISAVSQWPKGGFEAIKQALTQESADPPAANEAALRRLCIRAEILRGIATPPEDLALRREYQVNRLMQVMGQGMSTGQAELDLLTLEWVSVGPADDAAYSTLVQRFQRCRLAQQQQL